jgi:hypothetical protein
MNAIGPDTSLETLAAIVSEALERGGIGAVLCGGAVVSIYSHNAYQSHDLDFVTSDALRRIEAVMTEIGFVRGKGRHFVHPDTDFTVEFPRGPVMIGDAPVTEVAQHATSAGIVRLLTPTDSVKDRLAAFLHWNDRQGVEQAVQIIRRQAVDLGKVESWVLSEPGQARERYALVRERLQQAMIPHKTKP